MSVLQTHIFQTTELFLKLWISLGVCVLEKFWLLLFYEYITMLYYKAQFLRRTRNGTPPKISCVHLTDSHSCLTVACIVLIISLLASFMLPSMIYNSCFTIAKYGRVKEEKCSPRGKLSICHCAKCTNVGTKTMDYSHECT